MFDIEKFVYKHWENVIITDRDYMVDCPFCDERVGKPDTDHHMGIGIVKQAVHCFRCDYSRDWIGFVMDFLGVNYANALGELYVQPRMVDFEDILNRRDSLVTPQRVAELPEDFMSLKVADTPMMKLGKHYLAKRGFDAPGYIGYYNLGMAEHTQPYRIIIPIENGYWQGRRIYDWMEPKYVNPQVKAGDVLFNARALDKYDEVAICEGAFSAMAIGSNAIALISKQPTAERVERILASRCSRFIIALEPGAFGSMGRLMQSLYRNGREVVVWSYSSGDPADPAGKFTELEYNLKSQVSLSLR